MPSYNLQELFHDLYHGVPAVTATDEALTINVPSDENTVRDALMTAYKTRIGVGHNAIPITIHIENGHQLQTNIRTRGGYYGHIRITSADSTVPTVSSFPSEYVMNVNSGSVGPRWEILVDADGNGDGGIRVQNASMMDIAPNSGVINSARLGLNVDDGAMVMANSADFSGAASHAAALKRCVQVSLRSADLTGAGTNALDVNRASIVDVEQANLDNASQNGIDARTGAQVDATAASVQNPGDRGIVANDGARVNFANATVEAGSIGTVISRRGSWVNVRGASATGGNANGNPDLHALDGSLMSAEGCTTSQSTDGNPHEGDMNISPNTTTGDGIIFATATET